MFCIGIFFITEDCEGGHLMCRVISYSGKCGSWTCTILLLNSYC